VISSKKNDVESFGHNKEHVLPLSRRFSTWRTLPPCSTPSRHTYITVISAAGHEKVKGRSRPFQVHLPFQSLTQKRHNNFISAFVVPLEGRGSSPFPLVIIVVEVLSSSVWAFQDFWKLLVDIFVFMRVQGSSLMKKQQPRKVSSNYCLLFSCRRELKRVP